MMSVTTIFDRWLTITVGRIFFTPLETWLFFSWTTKILQENSYQKLEI